MGATVANQYFSGQGVLMLATRDVDGKPEGFVPVGNVSALTVGIATTEFKHKESTSGVRGTDLTMIQEIAGTMNITMESLQKDNLALALYGAAATKVGASATAEMVKGYLGKYLALENIQVSNVVVKNTGGVITYELDKNYTVNAATGSIYIMPDAAQTAAGAVANITDAQALEIDYDYAEQDVVDALLSGDSPVRWARFEGLNTADGSKPVVVDCFKVGTKPLAELGLINEELAQMTIEAEILSDSLRATGSKYFSVKKIA